MVTFALSWASTLLAYFFLQGSDPGYLTKELDAAVSDATGNLWRRQYRGQCCTGGYEMERIDAGHLRRPK